MEFLVLFLAVWLAGVHAATAWLFRRVGRLERRITQITDDYQAYRQILKDDKKTTHEHP